MAKEERTAHVESSADVTKSVRSMIEEGKIEEATRVLNRLPRLEGVIVHGEKRGRTIGYPTANLGEWNSLNMDAVPADGIYAGWLCVESLEIVEEGDITATSENIKNESTIVSSSNTNEEKSVPIPAPARGNHGYRADSPIPPNVEEENNKLNNYIIRLPAAISIGTNPTFAGDRSRQVEAYALDQNKWINLYDQPALFEFVSYLRPTIKFSGENWLADLLKQMEQDCTKARELLKSE